MLGLLNKMEIRFEELTHENYHEACEIDRKDIPEAFVDSAATLLSITDYGVEHHCIGHTFLVRLDGRCIGTILLGEAIPWETDPPQVREQPFYRLMAFVIDRKYRGKGLGGQILEAAVDRVYREFGVRPIVLGCHKENKRAASFYEKHRFAKTDYTEKEDCYYLRFPGDFCTE